MENLYKSVRNAAEDVYKQAIKSFRKESRFNRFPTLYASCLHSTNLIKSENERSLRIYVKANLDGRGYVPVECYEIKNYKTSVEVSVYYFTNGDAIRDFDDAEVVVSAVNDFFDNLLKFMKATKGHSNTDILKRINDGQPIKLKMKHLKKYQDMMSFTKNDSIFNPYTNLFVDEKSAMKSINKDVKGWAELALSTERAVSWRQPLVFYEKLPSVIARIYISERLSDRLCFMIALRLIAHLEKHGIRNYETSSKLI